MEAVALLIGFALVGCAGAFHHVGLRALDRLIGPARSRPNRTILLSFFGLLTLHTAEILLFAGAYRVLLSWNGLGGLGNFGGSWSGLIYYSGINFTTLGYTEIEAAGPIRLVSMMQALGGFMILSWSAAFVYSIWYRGKREARER